MDDTRALASHLYALTPVLIADTMDYMQQDAVLMMRYGGNVREMAEQAVVSFREVLLGAMQFDAPQLMDSEINWLQGLLESRQVDTMNLTRFLNVHRRRLSENLPADLGEPVIAMLNRLLARLETDDSKEDEAATHQNG